MQGAIKNKGCFLSTVLFINKPLRCAWLVGAVILLTGCASMSKQECLTANWLDQGFRDGRSGQPLTRIVDHRQACTKVGVIPKDTLYFQGRDQGIVHYCTSENGLAVGRQGHPYRNACPAALEHKFLVSYKQGKQLYEAEQRIEALSQDTHQLELLLRDEDDREQRRYLRHHIRGLDWELQRARDEQRYLERNLERDVDSNLERNVGY
ncbi:DUF2799 domain-containing protein [Oceanisphaera sp. IT1-181]|uniref:DUF2799 domain-containing protein n=1 Tax=Oceanisphaera sp. IT1-181 TaxID=3081199 RepID=UPI0029CA261B|nr:DUF2799 domain-containing protein [Oceanisphaera sp. IT1-181]